MKKIFFIAIMMCCGHNPVAVAISPSLGGFPSSIMVDDSRCSVSLSSGTIDYGNMSRGQLQEASRGSNTLTPGKRTLMLSVVCPHAQPLLLTLRGERTAKGELRYGDRGNVAVRLFDMHRDGQSVQITSVSSSGIISGIAENSQWLLPGQTISATLNGQIVSGKVFNARLEIEPIMSVEETRVGVSIKKEAILTLDLMN